MAKVQQTWDAQWDAVFAANWEGLPELPEPEPQLHYPLDVKILQLLMPPVHLALGAYALRLTLVFWRAAFALLGARQWPVLAVVALYVAVSFYVYSKPVDARTLHSKMLKQRKQPPALAASPSGSASSPAKKSN